MKQEARCVCSLRDHPVNTRRDALVVKFSGYKLIAVASLVVADVTGCRLERFKINATWEQANQTCSEHSMQLATIPDAEIDSSLYNTSCARGPADVDQKYWVGARAKNILVIEGIAFVFVDWIDGTRDVCSRVTNIKDINDTHRDIQPGQCVYARIQDGKSLINLNGSDCDSDHGYVCERSTVGE